MMSDEEWRLFWLWNNWKKTGTLRNWVMNYGFMDNGLLT